MSKYVVIGNSAAGVNAVEMIHKLDPGAAIDVISHENTPIYSRCLLSYFIAGTLARDKMVYREDSFYERNKVTPHLDIRVINIDPSAKQVFLDNGTYLPYDRLLIATGARSKMMDVAGIDLPGIYPLRNLSHACAISERVSVCKHAVILGGGLVGLKAAQALNKRGIKVSVVVKSGRVLSQMLDSKASEIYGNIMNKQGITMIPGKNAAGFEGNESVEQVIFDDGSCLETQLVIVGKGVHPNMEIFRDAGGETDNGIKVDTCLQTNLPGIYAAGDVIETTDVARNEKRLNAIWPSAVEQGLIAAANMVGNHLEYSGSLSMNSMEFFDVPVISQGVVQAQGADYEEDVVYQPKNNVYKKIVVRQNRLVGMVFVRDIDNAGIIGTLIRREIDISSIRHRLLEKEFSVAHILKLIQSNNNRFPEKEFGFIQGKL